MSDIAPIVSPDARPLSKEEAKAFEADHEILSDQLKGDERSRRGYQYVAEPAAGHDVVGLWHTFPCSTRSGYAAHACALHSMLEKLGVPTMLAPHPVMEIDVTKFPEDRSEMLMRWLKTPVGIPKAFIASFQPDVRGRDHGVPAYIPYVAFEANPMSPFAARVCESPEMTTAIWCVSEYTRHCYASSGVDPAKLRVVRPAICDGPWAGMIQQRAARNDGVYKFGTNGTWHERKGFHNLVRAYFAAFSRADPVLLVIRTSYFGVGRDRPLLVDFERKVLAEITAMKAEFQRPGWESPRIKLLTGTGVTDAELIEWIGSLDAYVNPSFGEGLGIPPVWAAAQGVPLITSDYGAVGDLARECSGTADASSAFRVFPSKLVPVPREMLKHSAFMDSKTCWGGYEVSDLSAQMRVAYDSGDVRTLETAAEVRRLFSYPATRAGLLAALRPVVDAETLASWGIE
jgi:glycosyltransferase involved in cell wall biosynthesis